MDNENDDCFMMMEYAPIGDFKSFIWDFKSQKRKYNVKTLKKWMKQLTEALLYIHLDAPVKKIAYVHRDIKPENILVMGDEGDLDKQYLKLSDFGIAKAEVNIGTL